MLSVLRDTTDEDAFHDMILCCFEAMGKTGRFSKEKALSKIKALTQKQKQEKKTLYNPHRNISLNQCIGESKTPVSEWLNVSGWREWE